jgi:hypothetical protein
MWETLCGTTAWLEDVKLRADFDIPDNKSLAGTLSGISKVALMISVVVARFHPTTHTRQPRWLIEPSRYERKRVTILRLMDDPNASITSIRVFRKWTMGMPQTLSLHSTILGGGAAKHTAPLLWD